MIPRETPGISYEVIDKIGYRTCQNVTMKFENVRVPEEDCFALGDGDFVINRTFTWSGPVAAIAAVAVARCAYEFTLNWAKTYTGGGAKPIINHQAVGNLLTEIAANIEAARYMCWKTAHYMDMHDSEGQAFGSLNKIFSAELMFQTVFQCMRVMGINSVDKRYPLEKCLREAIIFPLYDAGNLAMQRRKAWGVMADPAFNPMAFVDCAPIKYKKSMEGYGVLGENATEEGEPLLTPASNDSPSYQSGSVQQVTV